MNDEELIGKFVSSQTAVALVKEYQNKQKETVELVIGEVEGFINPRLNKMFDQLRQVMVKNILPEGWKIVEDESGVLYFSTSQKINDGNSISLKINSTGGSVVVEITPKSVNLYETDDGTDQVISSKLAELEIMLSKKYNLKKVKIKATPINQRQLFGDFEVALPLVHRHQGLN